MGSLKLAERTVPRPPCKKPCKSCPFRRDAMPGYLGSYGSPGEFLEVHYAGETLNPCHESIDYDDPDWRAKFMGGKMGRACKGQSVFFANSLKLPKHGEVVKSERDREAVFSWPAEFLAHHGGE